jgi:para-nitrobenzyl esterase
MSARIVAGLVGLALAGFVLDVHAQSPADLKQVRTKIETGTLVGRSDGMVEFYKNVPFAAPPVGSLRWAPPQRAAAWKQERDASTAGAACPQTTQSGRPNAGGYMGPISEDCLSVNVFKPANARNAPVMVWIYGGGNAFGANSLLTYDGGAFARDGVILVAVNYRLGAFGFFAHPALTKTAASGVPLANYGLLDQLAGLAWVKRNIKAFGGDPGNVTVFGESAGGIDILALMSSPQAKGLFQKVVVESGGGWLPADSLAQAESKGVALAQKAGLSADATTDQLRGLSVEALLAAASNATPALDGRLLLEQPESAFAKGTALHVPMIIGSNSFEASLMSAFGIPPGAYLASIPATVKAAYTSDGVDETAEARAIFTDTIMGAPARWIADKASLSAPTWLYHFSYVATARRGQVPGAAHASEIGYVFDTLDRNLAVAATLTSEDRALAKTMHSCWVSFAKTGKPVCDDAPAWPSYQSASDQLLEFNDKVSVEQHYRKTQWDVVQSNHLTKQ